MCNICAIHRPITCKLPCVPAMYIFGNVGTPGLGYGLTGQQLLFAEKDLLRGGSRFGSKLSNLFQICQEGFLGKNNRGVSFGFAVRAAKRSPLSPDS